MFNMMSSYFLIFSVICYRKVNSKYSGNSSFKCIAFWASHRVGKPVLRSKLVNLNLRGL